MQQACHITDLPWPVQECALRCTANKASRYPSPYRDDSFGAPYSPCTFASSRPLWSSRQPCPHVGGFIRHFFHDTHSTALQDECIERMAGRWQAFFTVPRQPPWPPPMFVLDDIGPLVALSFDNAPFHLRYLGPVHPVFKQAPCHDEHDDIASGIVGDKGTVRNRFAAFDP